MSDVERKIKVLQQEVVVTEPLLGFPVEAGLYAYKCEQTDNEWRFAHVQADVNGFLRIYGGTDTWGLVSDFFLNLCDIVICRVL